MKTEDPVPSLPHADILKRVNELRDSGKLERWKAAILAAGVTTIKAAKAAVEK